MSAEAVVLVGAGAILIVAVVSGLLEKVWLTEPFVATVLGVLAGSLILDAPMNLEDPIVLTLLELTLALVLFTDASRIDVARIREGYSWPLRMLLVGIPLVIVMGAAFGVWYLGLPLGMAALVAVILAPTDAALAEPVLHADALPIRVRQTLNVESGLNDGLVVPLLFIAIGLIESEGGESPAIVTGLILSQLGIGLIGGVALGWLGAKLIGVGTRRGWMNPLHQKMAAVTLALAGYAGVQLLGGSGFVATFVAGGLMSHLIRPEREYLYDFAEVEGQSLVLLAFFVVGAGPVTGLLSEGVAPEAFVMVIASLFLFRPLSVAVSLIGQRLHRRTVGFLGWFGPRGLATVVFLLVAGHELGEMPEIVREIGTLVVVASVVAHGMSAVPLTGWLARTMSEMPEEMPEMGESYDYAMRRH